MMEVQRNQTYGARGEGDVNDNNTDSTAAIIIPSSVSASERTLLTPQQTYFADEKVPIPQTNTVNYIYIYSYACICIIHNLLRIKCFRMVSVFVNYGHSQDPVS